MDVEAIIKLELKPHILTCGNVAALLQVTESTIEHLHRIGQLKGFTVGKHLRWWPDHVREFAEQLAQKARG